MAGLMAIPAPAAAEDARLLVQPRPGLSEGRLGSVLRGLGAVRTGRIEAIDVITLRVPEQARERVLTALQRNPHISFAEPDRLVPPVATSPNDPYYDDAWHLPQIQAPTAWDSSRGSGRVVAVLDTGVDAGHADLGANVLPGYNSVSGSSDSSDVHGHGTLVAGVVAALGDNGEGVASLAWQTGILPVRITDRDDGYAYFSDIANGLTWAADNGAHVANISYNVSGSSTIQSAAKYMMDRGGLVVVAAGNDGSDPGYSDSPYLIAVSATNSSDSKTSWSNYGYYIDVAAPGAGIWTTKRGGGYGSASGTSFASPVTAGVIALMTAGNEGLAPADVERLLEASADDLGLEGADTYYGHGRVNAAEAVSAAASVNDSDTTAPAVSLVSPAEGAEVSGLVAVDVDASDSSGVSYVELQVNGAPVATDETSPWGFSWDSETVSDGDARLSVKAVDSAGNSATDEVGVLVANTSDDAGAPTVTITSPADGATVSGHVDIAAYAEDDTGVEMLSILVDGKLLCAGGSATLNCRWNSRKADAGSHTITAEAEDAAGNTGSASVGVTVDGKDDDSDTGGGNGNNGNNGKGPKK
ncbi:peptidase S8 [Spiribacter halobius]|uniref:Peptidase S8 n=2 Tax=Sediminicurvatus halobius TaxID=2182432 RepID=A0A2U2MWM6_9GAMM|nr:peptidase S8 [Spiribacter halobius]